MQCDVNDGAACCPSDGVAELPINPDLPIIDSHHHLGKEAGYSLAEMLRDVSSGHKIAATVHISNMSGASLQKFSGISPVNETRLIRESVTGEASVNSHGCQPGAGIVGYADLRKYDVRGLLEEHLASGDGRFRGIRQTALWDADPMIAPKNAQRIEGLLLDKSFRRGMKILTELDLRFDALVYHPQLPELIDLCEAQPEAKIAVEHCGLPLLEGRFASRSRETFNDWKRLIASLSRYPNVVMKLSGLKMPLENRGVSASMLSDLWRPFIETCLENFGASRCMFGSNFPESRTAGYVTIWNAYKKVTSQASLAEKYDVFFNAANRFYNLGLVNPSQQP